MSLTSNQGLLQQQGTDRSDARPTAVNKTSGLLQEYLTAFLYMTLIVSLIVYIINQDLPKAGHDYNFFIAHMLDSHLHYKVDGLGIQWYTASFGAGVPAYPNPQNVQYSLPQLFMFVVNPWLALMLSLATYSAVGFGCFYLFLREELGCMRNASALGASFILVNGFFVEHAIVGHVGFQTFPLLGAILFLAFTTRMGALSSGVLIGLLCALIVNQAGFVLLTIFVPSVLMILPLVYWIRSESFQPKVLHSMLIGAGTAVILSLSKLSAVLAFMRFFPRSIADDYGQSYAQGILGMLWQLVGFPLIVPFYIGTGRNLEELPLAFEAIAGGQFGIWETNIFLATALLLLLVLGVGWLLVAIPKTQPMISRDRIFAAVLLGVAVWLATDLTLAQGWLYSLLKPLPILRSLHVNVRYAAAFIYPLAILGAWIFHQVFKGRKIGSTLAFVLLGIVTIGTLSLYIAIPQDVHNRSFNIQSALPVYAEIDKERNFTVNNVAEITDLEVFHTGSSNLDSPDPMFGYEGEHFRPQAVPGPVLDVRDGHYNFTNPASFVFPAENGLQPFDLFRTDQQAELELLLNHKQPKLRISNWQEVANIVNLIALAVSLLHLGLTAIRQLQRTRQVTRTGSR